MLLFRSFRPNTLLHQSSSARRFDGVTIAFHWTTVGLITGLFASAWLMEMATGGTQFERLIYVHRSLGAVSWIVAICRLFWRLTRAFLPPWPSTMPKIQRILARISEYGLYALLLVQPLTGIAQSLTRGRSFALLAWQVPSIMA